MNALILALIQNILVPEILAILKRRQQSGLPFPTEAELISELNKHADAIEAKGLAWLAQHGGPTA